MQYLFWLVLMFGNDSVTVVPVPYQREEECLKAAEEYHDQSGHRNQWGNCVPQPVDDIRQFHTNLMGPAYHD